MIPAGVVFSNGGSVPAVNWVALKPTWMLFGDLGRGSYWDAEPAAIELWDRQSKGELSPDQLALVLDGCLDRQMKDPLLSVDQSWTRLIGAAYDAGVVTPEQLDRHVGLLFATFPRTQQTVRETYVLGEPFPFGDRAISMYPEPQFNSDWAPFGRVIGMAAYLERATLDGKTLELVESPVKPVPWDDRDGAGGSWVQFGNPRGRGYGPALFPEPTREIARMQPAPGQHEMVLDWRIDVFFLGANEPEFEHPYRPADVTLGAKTTHSLRVIESVGDVLQILGPGDLAPHETPRYRGGERLSLRVSEARKLRRDGDWYFTIRGALIPEWDAPDRPYAVLARIHLEIDGVRYSAAEHQGIMDVFYDWVAAPGVEDGGPRGRRGQIEVRIIDLPRVDRVDLVLEPAAELQFRRPYLYSGDTYWGEPIVLRDVPLDWSGVDLEE